MPNTNAFRPVVHEKIFKDLSAWCSTSLELEDKQEYLTTWCNAISYNCQKRNIFT